MNPLSLMRAVILPLTEPAVLFPLLMFWLLVSIGTSGSVAGIVVLVLTLPALFRYQMIILECRASGQDVPAFDAEFFNWVGSMWTLFPLPIVVGLVVLGNFLSDWFGDIAVDVLLVVISAVLPASIAVLAITRSPLQSVNPIAMLRLVRTTGGSFWIASLYLLFICWAALWVELLPNIPANLVQLFLLFSFSSLTGALLAPYGLMARISIPDGEDLSFEQQADRLEAQRAAVLTHAYGFVSRGNRAGGFDHIAAAIAEEPDVAAAWAWYFERMLDWENRQHALFFAQRYIHDLLQHGENVPALKLIMRCRLINDAFHPFREDLPLAIEAAEKSGNIELAAVLKRV